MLPTWEEKKSLATTPRNRKSSGDDDEQRHQIERGVSVHGSPPARETRGNRSQYRETTNSEASGFTAGGLRRHDAPLRQRGRGRGIFRPRPSTASSRSTDSVRRQTSGS